MNAKAFDKLQRLAVKCSEALKDPRRQSEHIFRGDMWAIIGACYDIEKALAKKKAEAEK